MRLAFKNGFSFGYSERDVPITLKIGTMEDLCLEFGIHFYQIGDKIKKDNAEFMTELLYQGYRTACKEAFKKPKFDRVKAILWYNHLSKEAEREFSEKLAQLLSGMTKMSAPKADKKKVKAKQPSRNLELSPSGNLAGVYNSLGVQPSTNTTRQQEGTGDEKSGNGRG